MTAKPRTDSRTTPTHRKVWTPSPLLFRLIPKSGAQPLETKVSAASELFWSDVRNKLLEVYDSLRGSQPRGVVALHGETDLPKSAIPSAVLGEILDRFGQEASRLLKAAAVRVEQDIIWQGVSDFGQYRFRLAYSPHEDAGLELADPDKIKLLAPIEESCETEAKPQHIGTWDVGNIRDSVAEIVGQLPTDPHERVRAIGELYRELQSHVAPLLAPAIAALLKDSRELPYEEKSALAQEVNSVLADARLAIRDPKSNLPATLLAQRPKVTGPTSYLRIFDTRKASDGKRHFCKVEDLGEDRTVELIDERGQDIESRGK